MKELANNSTNEDLIEFAKEQCEIFPEDSYMGKYLRETLKMLQAEQCEDAISRAEAIRIASGYCHPSNVAKELAKLPPVKPTHRWIPVSERLPEKNMRCLVAVGRFNFTEIATYSDLMEIIDHKIFYQGDVGNDSFKNITQYVKAWMPLPKAYKVVKKCCSDCKHHTNGEIHGVTPCGSCGDDKKNFEQK